MDVHRTTYLGENQIVKSKTDGKSSEAPKIKIKEPLIHREKRAFGTVRNQNALAKAVIEKPTRKHLSGIPQKPTKLSTNITAVQETETPKKPSENHNVERKTKKKSVHFRENVEENKEKALQEGNVSGVQTPLKSPFSVRPNVSGTPYHSAERCSKCRFDKLETTSYWLGQIRLAEAVGKHFVSAAFFLLAYECKAEPFRNIKVELKKYLARHEYLSGEKEWKDLSLRYGLLKEESSLCHENEEGKSEEDTANNYDLEEKQIVVQITGLSVTE